MKVLSCRVTAMGAVMILLASAALGAGKASGSTGMLQTYSSLPGAGEVLLDNDRVVVQKFVIQPGQATGSHSHHGHQLLVFVKGGLLTSRATGRTTLWKDGRVVWQNATDHPDEGSTNSGKSPIEIIWVTLKPVAATLASSTGNTGDRHLNYPNIPGEDLLENDEVVVQRFVVNPGQWEGVHAHLPNMLFIHIKGGQWASRSKTQPETPYPHPSPDGEVGWMATIDIGEGHESRNIGPNPIDLIWVTLKK